MLRSRLLHSRWLAFGWLVFISILFLIPGSALPRDTWFARVHFDKWAHTGVFAVLLYLFCSAYNTRTKTYTSFLLAVAAGYGWLVEIIQKNWVPYRDFDPFDLLSDIGGSLLGAGVWWWVYKKNKPL